MSSVYEPTPGESDDEAQPLHKNGQAAAARRAFSPPQVGLVERAATPVLLAIAVLILALKDTAAPAIPISPGPGPAAGGMPEWHKVAGSDPSAPVGVWWDDDGRAATLIGRAPDAGGMPAIALSKDKVDSGHQMLLVSYVTKGIGGYASYDTGLPMGTQLIEWRKVGPKILMVALPAQHKALSDDPGVVSGVGRSFAESVLWSFDIAHDTGDGYLLDASDYLLRNWDESADFIAGLRRGYGAEYHLDRARSAVSLAKSKATAKFSCLEADLTFVAAEKPAGPLVPEASPSPPSPPCVRNHMV